MDYKNILKISSFYEKMAQQMQSSEATPGAYQDALMSANLYNENTQQSIINALNQAKAFTLVNVSITVHPDMTVALKIEGKHPNLAKAAKLLQNDLAPKMTTALKKAAAENKVGKPPEPISWIWVSGIGFEI